MSASDATQRKMDARKALFDSPNAGEAAAALAAYARLAEKAGAGSQNGIGGRVVIEEFGWSEEVDQPRTLLERLQFFYHEHDMWLDVHGDRITLFKGKVLISDSTETAAVLLYAQSLGFEADAT